jgi:hypothetical protein
LKSYKNINIDFLFDLLDATTYLNDLSEESLIKELDIIVNLYKESVRSETKSLSPLLDHLRNN